MRLRLAGLAAAALLCAAVCVRAAEPAAPSSPPTAGMFAQDLGDPVRPGLWVRMIAEGVWLFTAEDDPEGEEPIAANGLVVRAGSQHVMLDTGWNEAQAQALVEWFDRVESAPVRAAVVTHSHADRSGGARWLLAHGVRVEMLDSTASKLGLLGADGVETFHGTDTLRVGGRRMELYHPGAGHTRDNITVWLPDAQILFGGCLVKAAEARTLGFIEDADLGRWPASVKGLQRRYPDALFVVPGHGAPGGTALLDHTLALLRARRR